MLVLYFSWQVMNSSYAQTDSLKHYRMEGVVVTATRSEMNTGTIGRSVTVITENDIRSSPYRSVGELLGLQEGIYMIGTKQTPGAIQNVFMRGANSNHTLVMIDGIRLADPSSVDNALDLSELSLTNVERIEIVRGAHSTLYGSSAIGGAINIITKKNNTPGFNAGAGVQTGYFGKNASELTQNAYVNYTFTDGFYVTAELMHSGVTGVNAAIDTGRLHNTQARADKDGFGKLDMVGKAGYKTERWDIFGAYKIVNQKSDLDLAAYVDDPNYTIDFRRDMWSYGIGYRFSDRLSFTYLGEYAATDRKAINDSNIVDPLGNSDHTYFRGDYGGSLSNNELQSNLNWKGVQFVAGLGLYKETMTTRTFLLYTDPFFSYSSSSDLDTLDIHSVIYNAYLHADVPGNTIHEDLNSFTFGLGARLNRHTTYGNNFTYEINPSYRLTPRILIFASYATGFNAPSLYRLFTPESYYTSNIQRGNNNLRPETSVSYEMGFKKTGRSIRLSVSGFYTKVKNYIDYVYLWDKNIPIEELGNDFMRDDYRGDTYLNIGDQINQGVEAAFGIEMNSRSIVFGNITLIRGKLNYDPSKIDETKTLGNHVQIYSNGAFVTQGIKTSKLIRRPNTGNIGLTYEVKKDLSLTGMAQYTGKRRDVFYDQTLGPFGALANTPLKAFWCVDVSANYEVRKQWILNAKIENVLNEKITEIRGFRNRGRGVLLSLRYEM